MIVEDDVDNNLFTVYCIVLLNRIERSDFIHFFVGSQDVLLGTKPFFESHE